MIYILRCVIIASKYSSIGPGKIERFRRRRIQLKELTSQHILADWSDQFDKTIFKQIYIASSICLMDRSNIFFCFITYPKADLLSYLEEAEMKEDVLYQEIFANLHVVEPKGGPEIMLPK